MRGPGSGRSGTKTVLYIEDSAEDAYLFCHACDAAGASFNVKLAPGGNEGLAYLEGKGEFADRDAHPLPHFILLDIKMPNLDGFEVLKWIRSHPKVSAVTIALYSSSTVDRDVLRGYLTGTTFYLPKPQGMKKLREVVEALDECLQSDGRNCGRLMAMSVAPSEI